MGKGRNKVSLQDIADRLGISKNAVSVALNNKPGVSAELRDKIIKVANELNYSGLRKEVNSKSNNIIVLIPEYIKDDSYFYNAIYWNIEKKALSMGYRVVLTSISREMEEKLQLPELYYEIGFCGVLIIGVLSREYIKRVLDTRVPLVVVDNYYMDMQFDSVVTANIEGAYDIVKYLIENGHSDIGYVGSINMTSSLFERWVGFERAMNDYGLTINKEHCILNSTPLDDLLSNPEEISELIKKMETYPTAWFCGGDRIALALISALSRMNIRVPDDISVVGFDDIEASSLLIPALTTVKVNRQQLAFEAVELLIKRIGQEAPKQKITVYTELVVRDSVKKL